VPFELEIELRAVFVVVVVAPLLELSVDLVLQGITKLDVCGFLTYVRTYVAGRARTRYVVPNITATNSFFKMFTAILLLCLYNNSLSILE
jgi:hypothetical protein